MESQHGALFGTNLETISLPMVSEGSFCFCDQVFMQTDRPREFMRTLLPARSLNFLLISANSLFLFISVNFPLCVSGKHVFPQKLSVNGLFGAPNCDIWCARTAIRRKFLRFGLDDLKSLASCNLEHLGEGQFASVTTGDAKFVTGTCGATMLAHRLREIAPRVSTR